MTYCARVERPRMLPTGDLARELGVSRGAVIKWANASPPLITPAMTTPGGHHRWILEDVLAQLRAARERD